MIYTFFEIKFVFLLMQMVENTPEEIMKLLFCMPDRLGHATFLNEEAVSIVLENKMCIEICLSSNLLYVPRPKFLDPYKASNHVGAKPSRLWNLITFNNTSKPIIPLPFV